MYEELVKRLRNLSGTDNIAEYDEAADAIEDLIMRLHDGVAAIAGMQCEIERMVVWGGKPRWIPVTERLPEICEDVLAYIERNTWVGGGDAPCRKREITNAYHVNGRWYVEGCSGVVCIAWMPLPEPPKEADND